MEFRAENEVRRVLDDFIAGQRAPGQQVGGESSFTLDPQKVRERVATFCEQQTLYPLLRCLQAVISVCEGDIFIRQQEKSWEINFKWQECPPTKAFADLVEFGITEGFDRVGHRVAQHLFFGLSAAIGKNGYEMEWNSSQASFHTKDGQFLIGEPAEQTLHTLRFRVKASWWQKLLDQRRATRLSEEFQRLVAFSPKPIHLNGELLESHRPEAPEKPWASRFLQGSDLAWRVLLRAGQNRITFPYPELDFYRCNKEGSAFHLVREPGARSLPLSVAFSGSNDSGQESSLSSTALAYAVLFLSLESGRQDWVVPVSDGVLTEPVPVKLAGGGLLALTSEPSLTFDLSGLKVVQNEPFEAHLRLLKAEGKALKKQLALSIANVGLRASRLPKQYDQALSYLVGGPYAGFLGAKFGPKIRSLFPGKEEENE